MRLRMLVTLVVIFASCTLIYWSLSSGNKSGSRPLPIRPELESADDEAEVAELRRHVEEVKASIAERNGAGESRGAEAFAGKFAKEGFAGVRGDILRNLGRMGGADAKRILVRYLRTEGADQLGSAAGALARIDAAAAKEEAGRLLAGRDAGMIRTDDRSTLRKIAGE